MNEAFEKAWAEAVGDKRFKDFPRPLALHFWKLAEVRLCDIINSWKAEELVWREEIRCLKAALDIARSRLEKLEQLRGDPALGDELAEFQRGYEAGIEAESRRLFWRAIWWFLLGAVVGIVLGAAYYQLIELTWGRR